MTNLEARLTEIAKLNQNLIATNPIVSPDSRRIALIYNSSFFSGQRAVINGQNGKRHPKIGGFVFSPDSSHYAYVDIGPDYNRIVKDGSFFSRKYQQITSSSPIFSPDSENIAFGAMIGNEWFAVCNDQEQFHHNGFVPSSLMFSNNNDLVYACILGHISGWTPSGGGHIESDSKCQIIRNGKAEGEIVKTNYQGFMDRMLCISPDSSKIAYGLQTKEGAYVVVGNQRFGPHEKVGQKITFSPDSKHVVYFGMDGGIWVPILDGQRLGSYDSLHDFVFSPDSAHYAYTASKGKRAVVVRDCKESFYEKTLSNVLFFSPNSNRLVYGVEENNMQFIVLDGETQKKYSGLPKANNTFSPDSRHFVYVASPTSSNMVFVIDNKEIDIGCGIVNGAKFVFDSNNNLHTLAFKNNKFYRLDIQISD